MDILGPIVFILLSSVAVIAATVKIIKQLIAIRTWHPTEGCIIDEKVEKRVVRRDGNKRTETTYKALVQYCTDLNMYVKWIETIKHYKKDSMVTVRYNPRNHEEFILDGNFSYIGYLLVYPLGIFMIITGVKMLLGLI